MSGGQEGWGLGADEFKLMLKNCALLARARGWESLEHRTGGRVSVRHTTVPHSSQQDWSRKLEVEGW